MRSFQARQTPQIGELRSTDVAGCASHHGDLLIPGVPALSARQLEAYLRPERSENAPDETIIAQLTALCYIAGARID